MHQKWQFLDNFWLKVLALLFMTIDHLGLFLSIYYLPYNDTLVMVFRTLGRLAMPLFAFMIAEGVKHTKHFGKYVTRLGIMAGLISIVLLSLHFFDDANLREAAEYGNIFIDLLLGAVGAFCLSKKKIWLKLLALLPIGYGVLCYFIQLYEYEHMSTIYWLPWFIRTQYWWYSIGIIILCYLTYPLKNALLKIHAKTINLPEDSFIGTTYDRNLDNILNALVIVLMTFVLYGVTLLDGSILVMDVQTYALLTGVLILFYNGKRGYNKKWFSYGSYLYYPIHIGLLALIFILLSM